jgi:hypothetical protein
MHPKFYRSRGAPHLRDVNKMFCVIAGVICSLCACIEGVKSDAWPLVHFQAIRTQKLFKRLVPEYLFPLDSWCQLKRQ